MPAWIRCVRGVIVAALLLAAVPALARDRVALVIGNGAYRHAAALPNPRNDAKDVAAALRRIGFEVIEGTDLERGAMEDRIREFGRRLDGARLALFYYAGHGMQVAGRNYLVPVDARLERAGDLNFDTVDAALVLEQMEAEKRVNLVFLDACRDNPLARGLAPKLATRSLSVGQGLAPIKGAIGTLIAYATQPDNVALDGGGRNSPFTGALLRHVNTPGLEISALMKRVRADVIATTAERQIPWDHSSLTGEVFLVPGTAPAPAPPAAQHAALPSPDAVRLDVIEAISTRALAPVVVKVGAEAAALAFSPDSRLLAVGLGNGAVEILDTASRRVLRRLGTGRSSPDRIAFSIDGATLATVGDEAIKLWDVESGRLLRTLKGRGHAVALGFTPDGLGLVVADNRGAIRLWDVQEGKAKGTLGDRSFTGHLAAMSPDGRLLAWSGVDRAVTVWDVDGKRILHRLHGHKDLLLTVAFSADSRYLASAGRDGAVRVWEAAGKRLVHTLEGHAEGASALIFSPEGHWLASGGSDGSVKIWDLATGRLLKTLDHAIYVSALGASPDGGWLASADSEQRIMLWPLKPPEQAADRN